MSGGPRPATLASIMPRSRSGARVLASSVLVVGLLGLPSLACDRNPAPVELGSVAEAPARSEAKRLSFPGSARVELVGETRWRNAPTGRGSASPAGGSNMAMFVIPVVADGWTSADPVPAWLTSSEAIVDPGPWLAEVAAHSGPFVGKVVDVAGREPGMRTTSGWQKAIGDAEAKHGITSDPKAPIVSWPAKD